MRFQLVDKIDEICYGKYVIGTKCITFADDVFTDHFPGYPIFPGSLLQESLAQLAGSFFELIMKEKGLPVKRSVLTIVNKMKFRKPAEPGDKLSLRADIVTMQDDYGVASVKAFISEDIYAEGELTFYFVDIKIEKLEQSRQELYDIFIKKAKVVKDAGSI